MSGLSTGPNDKLFVTQVLDFAGIRQERPSPPGTLFANTGRRIYLLGDIDGRFRPRTNPYDLHAFGGPHPEDPLAEKLQGVWAQPVKGFAGYGFRVEVAGERWELDRAESFTQSFSHASFTFSHPRLRATRRDFAALDLPVVFTRLGLENRSEEALPVRLVFWAAFDLEDAWFTRLGETRNPGETVTVEDGVLVARAQSRPEDWAAAAACDTTPSDLRVLENSFGEMVFPVTLAPGESRAWTFSLAVVSEGGAAAARQGAVHWLPRCEALLAEKAAHYRQGVEQAPKLCTPDVALNDAFRLAIANLQMLEAENPGLGRYFFAGLEIFPFWFSCDGAYSGPGLLAAGFRPSFLNHVRVGLRFQEEGRVPHQISPAGHTAFAGNAQETSLWVLSLWDAYRWTGDRAFLREIYPGAVAGLLDYTLGTIDPDGDGYPSGPGMVEVEGMGEEKLDSAAYAWAALHALEEMAAALADVPTQRRARAWIDKIEARFDADWWDEAGGTYAMSLQQDNTRYPVPHWAVIVPLEVGLATAQHAAATLATLRARYLNEWGLKHTVGEDERVWTLPTATLSRAAYRCGQLDLGFAMLRQVARTLEHGPIGLFHELVPEGACIVQLWSAATFIRGVIEDLFGIEARADLGSLTARPHLPLGWDSATLENLSVGDWVVNVEARADGTARVETVNGPGPLTVR